MIRVFVPRGTIAVGATIALDDEEAHHLEVRRSGGRTPAHALDGAGGLGMGHLVHHGREWLVEIEVAVIEPRPADLVLAVGAGDRDRFLTIAEKAAELGVTRLVPLETARTRSVATRVREATVGKAERRAREGCKQSGNAWAPAVAMPATLEALRDTTPPGLRWFLADARGIDLPAIGAQEPVGWLVGPEGGFTDEEIADAGRLLDAVPIRLGRHVLRYETAAIAAAVVTDRARSIAVRSRRR